MDGSGEITEFRAAQYVRMSTEHQQYSTHNQSDKIREYAEKRGIEIIKTYADDGKSGLSIGGRAALQQLIADVESGAADFNVILVYDVSRWGRFQDADESAYYEYICKRAGINVAYCAEQFENDGSPVSTIVKGVKRAMAGEYSRELSVTRDQISVVDDQIGGPTPARAIAAACLAIAEQLQEATEKTGTYHFSGAPDASWCAFAGPFARGRQNHHRRHGIWLPRVRPRAIWRGGF